MSGGPDKVLIVGAQDALSLCGLPVTTLQEMEKAADEILKTGPESVLIKGASMKEPELAQDYWTDGTRRFWITTPRITSDMPGKAAFFADAVAASIVAGLDIPDALVVARARLQQNLRHPQVEKENLPFLSPIGDVDFPWASQTAQQWQGRYSFPAIKCEGPELYPIVDSLGWIRRLAPHGVRTVQLRIKDLSGAELETEIAEAAQFARENGLRLFVNDYWELAIKHGAYGIHLGQEDLATARLDEIQKYGLRLGISTHSYFEAAVAHWLRPSYVALGPIYFTKLKSMRFAPQGTQKLGQWKRMLGCPLVAIGGITLENAPEVLWEKPDFISVVGDISTAANPEGRVQSWIKLLEGKS